MVDWTTSTGTASSNDFTPAAAFINIPNGQNGGLIPLNIIDDDIPEFSETFTVHLISALGGARLGSTTSTTVTILPNDDPYGALGTTLLIQLAQLYFFVTEFSSNSRIVMEPVDGSISVALTVNRNGGTAGIVSAQWEIIRSNGKHCYCCDIYCKNSVLTCDTGFGVISDDIRPTSGSVQFGTGIAERTILLDVQSDSIPEDDEVSSIISCKCSCVIIA